MGESHRESSKQEPSVLIVDDNPLIRDVLKSLLMSEPIEVLSCSNGEEAVDLLSRRPVDVIVCDVMMPKMDGYALHEQVRAKAQLAHIPFIFLTALGNFEEKSRGHEVGADDYVVKPFDPIELISLIRGKIRRSLLLKESTSEQYDQFRKKVLHTLSHEFRTPLVAINTGTEILLEQEALDRQKAKGLLEAIHRGGLRLERLVTDFMLLQQIEAGVAARLFESRGRVQKISPLVQRFVEIQAEGYEKEGFIVRFQGDVHDLAVRVYPPQLEGIVCRLLDNAVKFSQVVREIEVQVHEKEGFARVAVSDRGIGMSRDRASEATHVFSQLDRDQLEQQGSGIGLALCLRYAEIHGGRLEFSSREGGGTEAALMLPAVDAHDQATSGGEEFQMTRSRGLDTE